MMDGADARSCRRLIDAWVARCPLGRALAPTAALAVVLFSGGCSLRTVPAEGAAPSDFAVEVVVQPANPATPEALAERRPAVYLLQPGGEYSAAMGIPDPSVVRPAPMRHLDPSQVDAMWELLVGLGFDPRRSTAPVAAGQRPGMTNGTQSCMVAIWVRGDGSARWWHLPIDGEAASPAATRVARQCAALAWATDGIPPRTAPPRFDFGPDPYASFREPPASASVPPGKSP
ncbi:MAG: hypothetical protein O2819_02610 [Planctomycetota bacterium]|nr:hypothetical protein [Planctomycetota bacterium]MDA1105788.1 hypothetical protein [Planctomycetota bacterium]